MKLPGRCILSSLLLNHFDYTLTQNKTVTKEEVGVKDHPTKYGNKRGKNEGDGQCNNKRAQ